MNPLTQLVPMPDLRSVNTGVSPCPTSFLVRRYGMPREVLTTQCLPPSTEFWRSRMVTESVGPFRVTGHRLAVDLLRKGLARVAAQNKPLYDALGSAGMLCVRKVRGGQMLSNHGLGLAIDVTIDGKLDPYGDGTVQAGLLSLYSILKHDGWYWGVEFRKEDAMHFEVGAETVMKWVREGVF